MAEHCLKDKTVKGIKWTTGPEWSKVSTGVIRPVVMQNIILIAILCLFYISPYLNRMVHIYIKLFFLLLWMMSDRNLPIQKERFYPRKMMFWWGVYVFWMIAMCLIGHSTMSIVYYIARLPLFCVPWMMVSILRSYNLKEMKLLWKLFVAICAINLLQNYWIGFTNPEIFHLINKMRQNSDVEGLNTNAGGSDFVGLCLFTVPVFWIIHQSSNKGLVRLLSVLFMVLLSVYFIFINDRATAAVVLLMMIVFFLIVRFAGNGQRIIKRIVFGLIVAISLVLVFAQDLFAVALEIFSEAPRMAGRIQDMYEVMEGADIEEMDDGSLGARYVLWMTSVKTFFSSIPNFLIGVGDDFHEGDIASLIKYGVGCHSEFFDLPARYGIVGVIMVYKFFFHGIGYLKRFSDSDKQSLNMLVFLVCYIFFSFVNNTIMLPVYYSLLVFFPVSLVLVNKKYI